MKKIFFVVRERDRNVCLEKLREAGVLHIEKKTVASDALGELMQKKNLLREAEGVLRRYPVKKNVPAPLKSSAPPDMAAYILHLTHDKETLQKELTYLSMERQRVEPWGNFDPWSSDSLLQHGVKLFPYELPLLVHKKIGDDIKLIVIHRDKRIVRAFSVGVKIPDMIPFFFPELSLSEINDKIGNISKRIGEIENSLAKLAYYKEILEEENNSLSENIEFETARAGMEILGDVPAEFAVCWISGYIPGEKIDFLKQATAGTGWAMIWDDPAACDNPPTLIKNKPSVRIIQPLFSLLGTIPGYREYDISFSYMVFLCIFSAMIFGDTVYGIILFIAGMAVGIILKKKSEVFPDAAKLIILLSCCTIVWGCITGSWFGIPVSNLPPLLQSLIIPPFNNTGPLAQFPPFLQKIFNLPEVVPVDKLKTQWNIQFLCFTVGMIQLV
jgi:V/A-type H+-transporting ATPase subunit I